MRKYIVNILLVLSVIGVCSCASRKKNTAQTRMYHSFFARYNTYYNGDVAFKKAQKAQKAGHKDNYLQLLPLMIVSDKSTQKIGAGDYNKAIEKSQKAIKQHSIKRKPRKKAGAKLSEKQKRFYAQKEFNPFLWRAWMMMANAYFEKGEFTEAASTYIYITRLYENDPKVLAEARIRLAQCYAEMDWLYEAEDLISRIKRDNVPATLEREFARTQANLLLKQKRYAEAIPHIEKAVKRKNTTANERAREYYLIGQLYRETGDSAKAFKYFSKTISQSPPYELEFNARIRQTETITNQDKKKIIRSLEKMLKSPKNKSYISQLYYAIGNLHLSSKDTTKAVRAYETGLVEGENSGYGTAMMHLSLAKIYWEQQRFSKAAPNLQNALHALNEEEENYDTYKLRSEVLPELSTHTDIIEKNTELLLWATLDEEQLKPLIDAKIEQAEFEEELREKSEEKAEKSAAAGAGSDLATAGTAADMSTADQSEGQLWYFYNPQLLSSGIRSFTTTWGERALKDYWRLSKENISLAIQQQQDSIAGDSITEFSDSIAVDSLASDTAAFEESLPADTLSSDPTTREYYIQQIPQTDEQKAAMHEALGNALFEAARIFEEKLGDKHLALAYWDRFVNEYPEHQRMAEAYYHQFLCCSRWEEEEKAELYKSMLITNYPDSSISKRIQEPDFFDSKATILHKEDSIYAHSYHRYIEGDYETVITNNEYTSRKYPDGAHRSRFMFIDALSKLYSGKQQEALESIEKLVSSFPEEEVVEIAQEISTGIKEGRLLHSGISLSIWDRKIDGTIKSEADSIPPFSTERYEPYYFVLAYPTDSLDEKRLQFEMARYNFTRYMVRNFTLEFNRQETITLFEVKEFLNYDEAFVYRKQLYSNGEMAKLLEGIKAFVISKSNLELLLKYYSLDDYNEFYMNELLSIPEPDIDGYSLDEPMFEENEPPSNNRKRSTDKE